jgi:hypothetical protein
MVALTADDPARLHHHLVFQQKLGLPLQWISAAETRRREPHLAGKLAGAVLSPLNQRHCVVQVASGLRTKSPYVAGMSRRVIREKPATWACPQGFTVPISRQLACHSGDG